MNMRVRLTSENDIEDLLQLSILAWAPVFESFEQVLGATIFHLIYPEWKGIHLAVVGTGGDPGHAPARRSYEKAGYTGLPLVRYYHDL